VVKTDQGYIIFIVMELRKLVDKQVAEFPQGFQFKIHAYSLTNPNELVRIDNHHGKSPHYHVDDQEKAFV
jgi:hypothetical protein